MEGERWWDKELVDRSGVAADTGTPPRLLMMAPLFASVSRNDTNSSEKLCGVAAGLISRSYSWLRR